jgi:hypothetical protein
MKTVLLRQIWSTVESTQAALLLQLDDRGLASLLVDRVACDDQNLSYSEKDTLSDYVQAKLPLIRDMAQSRLASGAI